MSSNDDHSDQDPVANLTMQPAKSILKPAKSTDEPVHDSADVSSTAGMTRSESKR